MKSKSLILLVLSIGFGLVAAIGISQVMKNQTIAEVAAPRGPVLLATGPLSISALLTDENVKLENWPVDIIPDDAITSLDEVTDMVTLSRLSKGMPIVKSAIRHKNIRDVPDIPKDMKVVAVRVSADNMIGNLLKPGNKVDVIGVFKKRDKRTNQTTTSSRTFLKALQVYNIGDRTTAQGKESSGNTSATSIVGLLVTQKQSEALVFVRDTGSIQLVLRGDDVKNDGSVEEFEDLEKELLAVEEDTQPEGDFGNLKIWKGPVIETTEFGNDGSPKSMNSDGNDKMSNSNGRGDSGNRGDSDRGIDDDKYRGE